MPMPQSKEKGFDGVTDVDFKDRKQWDQDGGKQSPYDRELELMGTPMFGGKTSREVMTDLLKMDTYKRLSPHGKVELASEYMKDMEQQARNVMMAEPRYANFRQAVEGVTVSKAYGRVSSQAAEQAAYVAILTNSSGGSAPAVADTDMASMGKKQ